MNVIRILLNWVFRSITTALNSIGNFFNTSPELMSDQTAKKLRDNEESKEFIEEIRNKRKVSFNVPIEVE